MTKNIRTIVSIFKKVDNDERLRLLRELMEGHAQTPQELSWRARLCTALERAKVYPQDES